MRNMPLNFNCFSGKLCWSDMESKKTENLRFYNCMVGEIDFVLHEHRRYFTALVFHLRI